MKETLNLESNQGKAECITQVEIITKGNGAMIWKMDKAQWNGWIPIKSTLENGWTICSMDSALISGLTEGEKGSSWGTDMKVNGK